MMSDQAFDEYLELLRTTVPNEWVEQHIYERQCEKFLLELGIKREASDFINLLKDSDRLKEVVFKVKNKAFL